MYDVFIEYDGHQSISQARKIAYLDAFVSVLVTLPQETFLESSNGDWLDYRVKEEKIWLTALRLEQPE